MMKENWYVLYTSPRFEKRVNEILKKNGVECYLPLHRCPRVWSDRVKLVDIPLFTSYIFVRCKPNDVLLLPYTHGVVRVVFYNGYPAIIRQSEIDAIKAFIIKAHEKVLCTGDEVEILTGLMKKKVGKVMRIKKKYLFLHIEQLAATVCVNVESVASTKRF